MPYNESKLNMPSIGKYVAICYTFILLKVLASIFLMLYFAVNWLASRSAADIEQITEFASTLFNEVTPVVTRAKTVIIENLDEMERERIELANNNRSQQTDLTLRVSRAIEYIVNNNSTESQSQQ